MKKATIAITLILWFLLTILLTLSIIGLVLLVHRQDTYSSSKDSKEIRSTWMCIGMDLKDALVK
jgi:hypothetical protein